MGSAEELAVDLTLRFSRSASGDIDLSAGEGKAASMNPPGSEQEVANRTRDNVVRAVKAAWQAQDASTPAEFLTLAELVNYHITASFTAPGARYRDFESDLFDYAAPIDAIKMLDQLAELWCCAAKPTAIGLAASVFWVVDLKGHPFVDGCGRTAMVLALLCLDRFEIPFPTFPSREDFIAGAYDVEGQLSEQRWRGFFAELI